MPNPRKAPLRIAILGNAGSGKSTLAARLVRTLGLRSLDLDTVAWEPGKVAVARHPESAAADVRRFAAADDGWVIEGSYASLVRAALDFGPFLVFLDPGVEACLEHCRRRPFEPHKYASKTAQDERLEFLLAWVESYGRRDDDTSRRVHEDLFAAYPGPKVRLLGGDCDSESLLKGFDVSDPSR